ncbi:MAG: ArsR/SmtB family transcription factor [Aristaeellaceae bacterium]
MDQCASNRQELARQFKSYQNVFMALGDETRQHIILTLLENEQIGMRVPDITEKTHLSRPAISHHLQILKDAGLISMHRVGTMNYYYVDANKSCWGGLKELIDRANEVIQMATEAGYPVWKDDE